MKVVYSLLIFFVRWIKIFSCFVVYLFVNSCLAASLVELIFANINQLHKKLGLDALDSKVNKRRVCNVLLFYIAFNCRLKYLSYSYAVERTFICSRFSYRTSSYTVTFS